MRTGLRAAGEAGVGGGISLPPGSALELSVPSPFQPLACLLQDLQGGG